MGPRSFTTVQELVWYNCSPVCGSPTWWLYSGANDDLLQENLGHVLQLPGLVLEEPLSLWQTTADLCLHSHRKVWLSLLWRSLLLSLGPAVHKVLFAPFERLWSLRFDFKCVCTSPTILLWLLLCPWMLISFFFFLVDSNIVLSVVFSN